MKSPPDYQPILFVAKCLLWWFSSQEKSVVMHDTECSYWYQVSFNNTDLKFINNFIILNHFHTHSRVKPNIMANLFPVTGIGQFTN